MQTARGDAGGVLTCKRLPRPSSKEEMWFRQAAVLMVPVGLWLKASPGVVPAET